MHARPHNGIEGAYIVLPMAEHMLLHTLSSMQPPPLLLLLPPLLLLLPPPPPPLPLPTPCLKN